MISRVKPAIMRAGRWYIRAGWPCADFWSAADVGVAICFEAETRWF